MLATVLLAAWPSQVITFKDAIGVSCGGAAIQLPLTTPPRWWAVTAAHCSQAAQTNACGIWSPQATPCLARSDSNGNALYTAAFLTNEIGIAALPRASRDA